MARRGNAATGKYFVFYMTKLENARLVLRLIYLRNTPCVPLLLKLNIIFVSVCVGRFHSQKLNISDNAECRRECLSIFAASISDE